jgi:hypothetical protein
VENSSSIPHSRKTSLEQKKMQELMESPPPNRKDRMSDSLMAENLSRHVEQIRA